MMGRSPARVARVLGFALLATALGACTATSHTGALAQRGGSGSGGMTCNTDADCRIRLPRPRACPNGGQSVPTACCRMNYCGICWSECNARSGDGAPSQPLVSM